MRAVMTLQTFLVTGANRGIGLGLVKEILALKNSRVVATCRQPDAAGELSSLQSAYGEDRVLVSPLDVTAPSSFANLTSFLEERDIKTIDVLIANAGVIGERQSFMETSADDMTSVFNTNVLGPMYTFQTLLQFVLPSICRVVVTVSSNMGSNAATSAGAGGAVSYRVSKAAVNMLSTCFAVDPQVKEAECKVLCVHPGWVQTDMGNSGGRCADISVKESASGIIDVVNRTCALQSEERYGRDNGVNQEMKEFETVLLDKNTNSNVLFVNYDGRLMRW